MIRLYFLLGAGCVSALSLLHVSGYLPSALSQPITDVIEKVSDNIGSSVEAVESKQPTVASREQPPPRVSVVTAREMMLVERVLVTGNIVPRREILISPQLSTLRVREVLADAGDVVVEGQVLARLVTDGLDAKLAQNDAAIAGAEAAIARAGSEIARAEAQLSQANADLGRARSLSQRNVVSESVFEERTTAVRTAEATLKASRGELRRAEAEKAQAEARRRELQWERDNAEIRAAAGGLILERDVRVGAMASPIGTPMFRIAENSEFELEAEVVETDLEGLRTGQQVEVSLLNDRKLKGEVRLIVPQIDARTRLAKVRITLGKRTDLVNGAFGRAAIVIASARQVAIPRSAIMYASDQAIVYVVEADTIVERTVVEGIGDGTLRGIEQGLASGDRVIAKSGTFLAPGDRVTPVDAPPLKLTEAR